MDCTVPGTVLGTEEEFVAGAGTKVTGDGTIVATVCGEQEISKDKAVSVKAGVQVPKSMGIGSIVYGRIEEIFEPIALVQLTPTSGSVARQVPPEGYAVLHAREVANAYVENVRDEVRIGDIIKAVVVEIRHGGEMSLSLKPAGMGVIKAFCSRCRSALALQNNALKCGRCGSVERRKLAPQYSEKG